MQKASKATGFGNKRVVIEERLRMLVKVKGQEGIRRLRGTISFEGNVRNSDKGEQS